MTGLFRREVVDAARGSWLGSISLVQPVRHWVISALAAGSALSVVLFMTLGDYTRRNRVSGELVPDLGLSTVVAPASGTVSALYASEGDQVGREAALVLISIPKVTSAGDDTLGVLRTEQAERTASLGALRDSQSRQLEKQEDGLRTQRAVLLRELSQMQGEIDTRSEQVRLGREIVDRYRQVADQRYVSLVQLSQQEQSVLELLNAQQTLQRQALTLRRTLAQLDQSLSELPEQRRAASAESSRELATLRQEAVRMEADGEMLLRSPVKGIVATRLVEPGQTVQIGQPVMSLLPGGSVLRAQLLVSSAAIGFVKAGDRVMLRYEAYPYQKFGSHSGKVIQVSRSAVTPGVAHSPGTEPMYRILVALDKQTVLAYGRNEPLRPGMRIQADIMSERRPLYEWALEPLYSVVGRTSN